MKLFKYLLGMGLCLSIAKATVAQTVRNYNPIIPDLIADPSIVKFGDTFYCYATTDGYDKGLATSGSSSLAIQRFGELVF
jgi:beta-xylosidase